MPSFDSLPVLHGNRFLRESARLYVLYMAVGLAAVPVGALYGIAVANGYSRWWTAVLCIGIGLICGRVSWKFWDRKLFLHQKYEYGMRGAGEHMLIKLAQLNSGQAGEALWLARTDYGSFVIYFAMKTNLAARQSIPAEDFKEEQAMASAYAPARN